MTSRKASRLDGMFPAVAKDRGCAGLKHGRNTRSSGEHDLVLRFAHLAHSHRQSRGVATDDEIRVVNCDGIAGCVEGLLHMICVIDEDKPNRVPLTADGDAAPHLVDPRREHGGRRRQLLTVRKQRAGEVQ
eukprot:7381506-Prymnesium_polylepis.2